MSVILGFAGDDVVDVPVFGGAFSGEAVMIIFLEGNDLQIFKLAESLFTGSALIKYYDEAERL